MHWYVFICKYVKWPLISIYLAIKKSQHTQCGWSCTAFLYIRFKEHSMKSNVVGFNKPISLRHTSAISRFEIVQTIPQMWHISDNQLCASGHVQLMKYNILLDLNHWFHLHMYSIIHFFPISPSYSVPAGLFFTLGQLRHWLSPFSRITT